MNNELRPFWGKFFSLNWKLGLFLILVVCITRFILVLNANSSGTYGLIGLVMIISAILPFVFLSKKGQKDIGIKKTQKYKWLLIAFISGLIVSFLLYLLGDGLYGNSYQNWYYYIGKSYKIPNDIKANDKAILFSIMTLSGITFSPIGEELFFRGIVHSCFEKSIGTIKASIVESSAFALTHISHFGLVFVNNEWTLFQGPTLIWVSSMFLISILFLVFKKYSGSILGAIICHSAFNLGMIYCIFYLI
ncbi:MAG: CPBP family intramembrane metalloprotease [Flavobacterium sp.]|nr:CPBP family intramembrane metalloprotease [Pedobacter sp.]